MSPKGKLRLVGLIFGSILTASLLAQDTTRELALPLGLLGLGAFALAAELVHLGALAESPRGPEPPLGSRLADGVVEIARMSGVETVPLGLDPRWGRFLHLRRDQRTAFPMAQLASRNPSLLGRVVLISVFVGRQGRAWTDQEIAEAHGSMFAAGTWLEREGRRRGQLVNIELAEAYFLVEDEFDEPVEVAFSAEGDDVGPMEANASAKATRLASRAAMLLGFSDAEDLVRRINPRVEADVRAWFFHLRQRGRSFAIPPSEGDLDGVGLAVCYARESSFPEPLSTRGRVDPLTVAHEFLHLFGATDKYGVSLADFPKGSVSPRDVMRLSFENLGRMTIDPLTASEIGWPVLPPDGSGAGARKNRP